jgi:hypothetical protein
MISFHHRVVRYVVEVLGIPESDIRSWWCQYDADYVHVRLWNWRRFRIAGIDLFRHEHRQRQA